MNRRDFIKTTGAAVAASSLPSSGEESQGELTGTTINPHRMWSYRVYCYERGQGEWTFNTNSTGSFAYQREYMTLEEEKESSYYGFMDGGKLHFASIEEAQNFIDAHAKAKDDTKIIDSIYDIYYVDYDNLDYESCQPTEIQVANYWFNGDTGRQISWVSKKPYTNYSKVECS
tara:strand:- start:360 stop:878 length:519 start_codon:yes stop_codon:yes gene_type:complete